MSLLGRLTGWDQQKNAHNAVLASHLSDTATPELRMEIARRLVIIQQQMRPDMARDTRSILADLSGRSRIVQMNFVALACNSLGIPPGIGALQFQAVENPYRAESDSSINRIGVAINDLSTRCGRQLTWPGNHIRVDFESWIEADPEAPLSAVANNIDCKRSAGLAFETLLAERIPIQLVTHIAKELSKVLSAKSDHELALATALWFFELPETKSELASEQIMARLTMLEWLQEGLIDAPEAQHFENQLYELYKP